MNDQILLERITLNPKIMVGKPVIRGTRLTVEFILNLLAHGATAAEILEEYDGYSSLSAFCQGINEQNGIYAAEFGDGLRCGFWLTNAQVLKSQNGFVMRITKSFPFSTKRVE
jgi:uncharacterized protein (DUF433 family)